MTLPSRTAACLERLADALEAVAECRTPGCTELEHAAACPCAEARRLVREWREYERERARVLGVAA